jgi:hypothetical protein
LTFAPTVAFFSEDSAIHLHRPPIDDPGSFGTTLGVAGGFAYNLNSRFVLWGNAFVPFTGNNSVNRDSGKPDKAIAFNAGVRYLVNPRLALDLFATNTLGTVGPLSLTADQDLTALGVGVVFMPDVIAANRRYPDSFNSEYEGTDSPLTIDGLGFFDGGTVPRGQWVVQLQGGSQGIMGALRYGILKDFEVGTYLDYIAGDTDESEQGFSGKIRLLNQQEGDPLTVSLAATLGLTNSPFLNFIDNDRDAFDNSGLDKKVPFLFQGDDGTEGRLFVFSVSLPLHYQFDNGAAVWLTPMFGYVQREGVEIGGLNLGGSLPLSQDFSVVGEVGANFIGSGNAFIGNHREDVIPWTVALRWNPSSFFGSSSQHNNTSPQVELYLTNRVGSSAWHQMRVRDDNDLAVGVGLLFPF